MSLDRMVVLSLSFKGTLMLISRVAWLMDMLTSVYKDPLAKGHAPQDVYGIPLTKGHTHQHV